MSAEYWTPSADSFVVSATAQRLTSADGQIEGIARIVNVSATVGFVGLITASATIGVANLSPIDGNGELYMAFSAGSLYIVCTGSPQVYAQAGYALK